MERTARRAGGTIERITVDSPTFGHTRTERIYLPNSYTPDQTYPLIVIHDGDDFMTYADLSVSLDNLIAAGDIPPVIAALVQTGDRMDEYPKGRRHARYLVNELLPAITESYSISDKAQDRVLLGASLGAVASLSTAFRYPGVFGGLVLKSGSFILDPTKLEQRTHPVFTVSRGWSGLSSARRTCPTPAPSSRPESLRGWPTKIARSQVSCKIAA